MKLTKEMSPFSKGLFYGLGLVTLYVCFVLSFVWWHCYQSPLHGGKNGPLDAYRHTLASAVVAYTTSPKLVEATTFWMERKSRPSDLMDQHNNAIGANIGENSTSLASLTTAVSVQVMRGKIDAIRTDQTTFLPKKWWGESLLW